MDDNLNISPDMINNLVNMLKNSNSNQINQNEPEINSQDNNTSSIDFETILKIKSIMETLNTKNDPKSNLIYSLKPYLRKSKQAKLDQYVNLLKITQISNLLKNEKGDFK